MLVGLIIFVGAGLGGLLRHWINQFSSGLLGNNLPYGTFVVNVLGSLLIGIVVSFFAFRGELFQHSRLFLTTGVLGGFTTFSAYSLDVVMLSERGENMLAFGYALVSVALSVGAVFSGMWLMKHLLG